MIGGPPTFILGGCLVKGHGAYSGCLCGFPRPPSRWLGGAVSGLVWK